MPQINFNNVFKELDKLKLDPQDKLQMRERVLAFMKLRPVRMAAKPRHQSRSNVFVGVLTLARQPMTIIVSIIILLTAGTSFAAESALPGDVLHPVKIGVNEEIRAAFALNAKAKADWDIRRAERRLEEAEELAASGRLGAQVSAKIEENFEAHADRVRDRIAEFEAKENFSATADLSSRFETSLRGHEDILARFATSTTPAQADGQAEVDELRIKVKAKADEQAKIRIEVEQRLGASATGTVPAVCIQVITPARNRHTGEVRQFATPCDVPEGWEVIPNNALNPRVECESCTYKNLELELGL